MICRARGCYNEAMPTGAENPKGLCGACHEVNEESPVVLKGKGGPGRPKLTPEQRAASAERERLRKAEWSRNHREEYIPISTIKAQARAAAREALAERDTRRAKRKHKEATR